MKCEDCGKKLPAGTPKTYDPYVEELYGKKKKVRLCKDCYTLRSDEI